MLIASEDVRNAIQKTKNKNKKIVNNQLIFSLFVCHETITHGHLKEHKQMYYNDSSSPIYKWEAIPLVVFPISSEFFEFAPETNI
jgi:hypothetical protein